MSTPLLDRIARATMTRNRVDYIECTVPACRYMHLMADGRAWAEWSHPAAIPQSPFTRRALARELPAKVIR